MLTELERFLGTLAQQVDWPDPSEHLPTRVVARISEDRSPVPLRRWVWALGTALMALVVLIPGTRQAVANLFQEAGVRIGFIEEVPSDLGHGLQLGRPLSIDELAADVDFELRYPEDLGLPDETYIDMAGTASMLWDGPILLSQREGERAYAEKSATGETSILGLEIEAGPALWMEGAEHSFTYLDTEGNAVEETTRLAANVLLWSHRGVDYRLELTEGLDRAIAIAESMRGLD